MPTLAELWRACYAAFLLLKVDPRGALLFSNDEAGARRSFVSYFLVIPMIALALWKPAGEISIEGVSPFAALVVEIERYIVSQLAFYLLLDRVTRRMGLRGHLMRYITAANWVSIPLIAIIAVIGLLIQLAGFSEQTAALLEGILYAVNVMTGWVLTRGALQMRPLPAFGLCLVEVLFSMIVLLLFAMLMTINLAP